VRETFDDVWKGLSPGDNWGINRESKALKGREKEDVSFPAYSSGVCCFAAMCLADDTSMDHHGLVARSALK